MKQRLIKLTLTLFIVFAMLNFVSARTFASKYPSKNAYESVSTMKGIQGAAAYGAQHMFFNFDINKCYIPDGYPECGVPYYEFEGKKYRFYDYCYFYKWISTQNQAGFTTNVQFMISWEEDDSYNLGQRHVLIDEDARTKTNAYYYAPASTGEGRQILRAFWSWVMTQLAERNAHIDNFILGNEVNAPIYWHYSGNVNWQTKVRKYAISFYDMRKVIRSFSEKPRVSICLDHSWNHDDEGRGIKAKDYLSIFHSALTELNEGTPVDDWCLSMHLYPAVLFEPAIWQDAPGFPQNLNTLSSDAYFVDGKNLSYITNYIKNIYGVNHRIMLTEQGFSSYRGENIQAASLAYSYYAAKYDPMVDCFILNADGSTDPKLDFVINGRLAGTIYGMLDDPAKQSYIDNTLLPVIGVNSWSQIVPNYGQNVNKERYVGTGGPEVYEPNPLVQQFVTRMYQQCLSRDPDESGLDGWERQLSIGNMNGAQIAEAFVFSQELLSKTLSNSDFVENLYVAMMGRPSDAAGKAGWVEQLENGNLSRSEVTKSFVESTEFSGICADYGIVRGTYDASIAPIEKFVERLYKLCLERNADQAGLYGWVGNLKNGNMNGAQMANSFFFSDEFVNKNVSNEKYVELLYNTLMGRPADADGKAGWVSQLQGGHMDRKAVMKAFIESTEFTGICANYGIVRGTL